MTTTPHPTDTDPAADAAHRQRNADAASAAQHFAARLRHETDPSDVAAARAAGTRPLVIDVRSRTAWDQGHIPGALHVPGADLLARLDELPAAHEDPQIVVYCWGPGCNGSTRAALTLAQAGYRHVREMIGGFEYWAREGFAIDGVGGRRRLPVDGLTAPLPSDLGAPAAREHHRG
ncbi:rhodanese-like domain-containing protein [Micromonospora okii]|uniref:rhodanese-like domain-containing protein n=1 Tax=Micromonospora okii TaxID=1182970 RepID=UPI001E4599E2|nr:rhodanese-like domain-containing protein [Micromonospora okii]